MRPPKQKPHEPTGHPTPDEVYERFVREQFDSSRFGDDFIKETVKRFKKAPTALFCKEIGNWIDQQLEEYRWTQEDLAKRLGVDRASVAYWIAGRNITTDHFAALVVVFKKQWSEIPFPARQEMAVAAYGAAISYTWERLNPGKGTKDLDAERFWCLFHLFSEPHWERAIRKQDPDLLQEEARRIPRAVQASLGERPKSIVSINGLKGLVSEWGVPWLICVKMPQWSSLYNFADKGKPYPVPQEWPVQ